MKLIVGLGNPGKEYTKTRHNLGFIIVDNYMEYKKCDSYKTKFNTLYTEFVENGEKAIIIKPQTYMNLSGIAVKKYIDFFKIDVEDIIVVCDDLDLNVGNYKLKSTGTSGGHNGLKDIESHIGTKDFKRLRVGIANNKLLDTKDYVLGKFTSSDIETYEDLKSTFNNILDDFLVLDFQKLMNKYNSKNR